MSKTAREETVERVLREHFIDIHIRSVVYSPHFEFRCQCGRKFGFYTTALAHVSGEILDALDAL